MVFFVNLAGNPWEAPNGWDTLHPQLNLNLDDQTSYILQNGATLVATKVSELRGPSVTQKLTANCELKNTTIN